MSLRLPPTTKPGNSRVVNVSPDRKLVGKRGLTHLLYVCRCGNIEGGKPWSGLGAYQTNSSLCTLHSVWGGPNHGCPGVSLQWYTSGTYLRHVGTSCSEWSGRHLLSWGRWPGHILSCDQDMVKVWSGYRPLPCCTGVTATSVHLLMGSLNDKVAWWSAGVPGVGWVVFYLQEVTCK